MYDSHPTWPPRPPELRLLTDQQGHSLLIGGEPYYELCPPTLPSSVETLSSTKSVPGAKNVGDHCSKVSECPGVEAEPPHSLLPEPPKHGKVGEIPGAEMPFPCHPSFLHCGPSPSPSTLPPTFCLSRQLSYSLSPLLLLQLLLLGSWTHQCPPYTILNTIYPCLRVFRLQVHEFCKRIVRPEVLLRLSDLSLKESLFRNHIVPQEANLLFKENRPSDPQWEK